MSGVSPVSNALSLSDGFRFETIPPPLRLTTPITLTLPPLVSLSLDRLPLISVGLARRFVNMACNLELGGRAGAAVRELVAGVHLVVTDDGLAARLHDERGHSGERELMVRDNLTDSRLRLPELCPEALNLRPLPLSYRLSPHPALDTPENITHAPS